MLMEHKPNVWQSLYNYDSIRGSLPPMNSHVGGSDSRSIVTPTENPSPNSDLLRFSTKSSITGDNEDGVWTRQNISGRRGGSSDENDSTCQRAPSVASSAISTGTTGTAWDKIMNARRPEQSYRTRIESTRTNLTAADSGPKQSGNWAKQGAAKPDRGALREAEKQREAVRKIQEQERARYEEEESSDSEWEL